MLITICAKHMELTEALTNYIKSKVGKLPRFFNGLQQLAVTIEPGDGVMGTAISNVADGVRIDSVENPSPAQRAGIREGDVITDIAGAEIRSVGDYLLATANRRVGENLKVRFRRGSSYSIVEVNLASGHAITP